MEGRANRDIRKITNEGICNRAGDNPRSGDVFRTAKGVAATLAPFEGRFVTRGGRFTVLEGEWPNPRTVIIEFPSREAAEGWYRSAAYQKIIGLRHDSSGNLVILDGA